VPADELKPIAEKTPDTTVDTSFIGASEPRTADESTCWSTDVACGAGPLATLGAAEAAVRVDGAMLGKLRGFTRIPLG
jgi:hypothetical protein